MRETDDTLKHIQHFVNESNSFYRSNQLDHAIAKAESAHSISTRYENCDEETIKKIEFNLAYLHMMAHKYSSAKVYLDRVKTHSISFYKCQDIGTLYAHIAASLNDNTDKQFEKRVDAYKSAAEMYAKAKKWHLYCQVQLCLAGILINLKNNYEALLVAEKVQMACLKIDDQSELVQVYNDLSTIYAKDSTNLSNVHVARKLLNRALSLSAGNTSHEICIYQNLSAVHNRLELYTNAIDNIHQAYALIGKDKPNHILSDLKYNEGYALYHLGQLPEAMGSFELSHRHASETNQKNIWESLEALATICMKANRYQQALGYIERAMNVFMINFQRKDMHKKSLIEKRLNIKMNKIRVLCGVAAQTVRPSKSLTSLDNIEADNALSSRNRGDRLGSQRSILNRPPLLQHGNWLDNVHSSSSSGEEIEDSSDENNQSKRSETRAESRPFSGARDAFKQKSLDAENLNLENHSSSAREKKLDSARFKHFENEIDDSSPRGSRNPPAIRFTPSTLPSILGGTRSDTNWSKNIYFDDKERSEKELPRAAESQRGEENVNSYSDGRRVFDPFSAKPKTPVLANSTLEFGAAASSAANTAAVDDDVATEISSNIAESDKPDRELVEDYKKVMFDEEKRLNENREREGDTALTLSQLSARSPRGPKESTFGSTYVAQSTFGTLTNERAEKAPQVGSDDEDENDKELKQRIAKNKLDLDQLASMRRNDEDDKSPAPRTPKLEANGQSNQLTNRSMESNKSYKLSRASSSKKGSVKIYQDFNRGIVPVEKGSGGGQDGISESKKSSKVCIIS